MNSSSFASTTTTTLGKGVFGQVSLSSPGWVSKRVTGHEHAQEELQKEFFHYGVLYAVQGRVIPRMHPSSNVGELILEHVPGVTLAEYAQSPRLTKYAWFKALSEVSGCIAALHAEGWVHCDLHANNVLVSPRGARLIDLSMARHRSSFDCHSEWQQWKRNDRAWCHSILLHNYPWGAEDWYFDGLKLLM
jgi:serine/threonine protein kinase